jgi:hypothetical protein
MAKVNMLSDVEVRGKREPGMYFDGAGLYLQVAPGGTKSWVLKFTLNGRAREMGLGKYPLNSLAAARQRRDDARRLLQDGIDPIEHRNAAQARRRFEEVKTISFREAADKFIAAKRHGWGNVKHSSQWDRTLAAYVYPVIGSLPVATVDTGLVARVTRTEGTVSSA